jgi:hypothetical protein
MTFDLAQRWINAGAREDSTSVVVLLDTMGSLGARTLSRSN